jgi:hypothetical protein
VALVDQRGVRGLGPVDPRAGGLSPSGVEGDGYYLEALRM